MDLTDRTILVTGATRGVGRELTRQLVTLGAHVVAVGRDGERTRALADELSGPVTPWIADLADPEAVDALVTELPDRHPDLSVVVNNAGIQVLTDFLTDDPETLRSSARREIAVNLDAVVALSAGLLPHLARGPDGAIVNVTSGLAIAPKRTAPVYCATKAGVRTFTRALRYQCEDRAPRVRVTEVVLPLVDTDMTRGRGRDKISAADATAAVIRGIRRGSPEVRVGKARVLPPLMRLSPGLAYRILRDG